MIYLDEMGNLPDEITQKSLFLFDLDGTVYIGKQLIKGANDLIKRLEEEEIDYAFFTNNSSKSRRHYHSKLKGYGIKTEMKRIISSNQVTMEYLKENHPGAKVMYLGNYDAAREMKEGGVDIVLPLDRNRKMSVDIAVMAYDTSLTYEKIKNFALTLKSNVKYFSTHMDINCPSEEGLIPDNGSFIEMFAKSTGRRPDIIFGKPFGEIINYALKSFSRNRKESIFLGDRMYTDIKMGKQAGIDTLLVLSGDTSKEKLKDYDFEPDYCAESLNTLTKLWKRVDSNESADRE